ncbi:proton-conducting transporter membrane subunit [Streptomyces aidingensis]|uniref:Multicomponent Na+:H+ antiporter subunit D n=1 Tax=Streptomyces aidingensis TaxID=910347 RepID=A0A1I1G1Q9_9ACTN|nr:proton-conducting transporter membrane subunit [Streptomyces aidingensis]SFC03243.1 multicomponent Na+:H+ antiporter subunit D [Streptomyces aidingensis]
MMTEVLLALPVALPLLAAGPAAALPRYPAARRGLPLAVTAAVLATGLALLAETADGSVHTVRMGDWRAGIAISFAADAFGALLLCTLSFLVLLCLCYAAATGDDREPVFAPLVLVLSAGVYGVLLTADLFNLFVLVEVALAPSYVLLTMGGGGSPRNTAGRIYITVSLLASTLFLCGVALLYGVTGSVQLGALAGAAADSPATAAAGAVVLLALGVKAAVVPVHGWLPRSYPHASPAVTALLSGLLTKAGLFALFRLYAVVYGGDRDYLWLLLAAAWLSMVTGVLGALGEREIRPILVFDMVSQTGFVLLGLALFTADSLTAAVFYLVQYVLVNTALLMCSGAVELTRGTDHLDRIGGLARREPLLTTVFVTAALSLAGLPPLSGFVAKLALLRAAALADHWVTVGVTVTVSLLTLLAMLRIWTAGFAGPPATPEPDDTLGPPGPFRHRHGQEHGRGHGRGHGSGRGGPERDRAPAGGRSARPAVPPPGLGASAHSPAPVLGPGAGMVRSPIRPGLLLPAAVLTVCSLLLGTVAAEPLLDIAETAAGHLVDPARWTEAVTAS